MAEAKKRKIDLNKMRAARLEKKGEGPVVEFGSAELQCPPELPFAVVEVFDRANVNQDTGAGVVVALKEAVRELLGPEQFELFMAEQPSSDDFTDFVNGVFESYGVEPGESSASPAS